MRMNLSFLVVRFRSFVPPLAALGSVLLLGLMLVCGGGSSGPSGPSITSFTAGKSTIFQGTGTTLTAVFTNGTGSIEPESRQVV